MAQGVQEEYGAGSARTSHVRGSGITTILEHLEVPCGDVSAIRCIARS